MGQKSPKEGPEDSPSRKASLSSWLYWGGLPTPPGPPGGTLDPSWPTHPSRLSRRTFRPLPPLQEGLPTPPGPLVGPPDSSQPFERASPPIPSLLEAPNWERLGAPPGAPGGTPDPFWPTHPLPAHQK